MNFAHYGEHATYYVLVFRKEGQVGATCLVYHDGQVHRLPLTRGFALTEIHALRALWERTQDQVARIL